jgi:hypothetical protein
MAASISRRYCNGCRAVVDLVDGCCPQHGVIFGHETCCGKPQGCTVTAEGGCRLTNHPAKIAALKAS